MVEAGTVVETLLVSNYPLIKEARRRISCWYKAANNHPPPPNRVTLERMMSGRVTLYMRVPPPGDSIQVETDPFPIYDSIPLVDNI